MKPKSSRSRASKPKTLALKDPKRLHAVFKGRVQGVGFRYYVETLAQQRGVTGWVRNLPKGDVEVLAEGDASVLKALLAEIQSGRLGPNIDRCISKWLPYEGAFSEFTIEYVYG